MSQAQSNATPLPVATTITPGSLRAEMEARRSSGDTFSVKEAIAVLAGRRLGTYDPRAHATFTLMRYVDDVAFHTAVRPQLNTDLNGLGVTDHTLLLTDAAQRTASENRARLWPAGLDLLARIAPQFRDAGFAITLPWDRTFETELDLRLAPAGPAR